MGGSFRLLEGFGNLLVFREPIRGSYSSGGVDIGTDTTGFNIYPVRLSAESGRGSSQVIVIITSESFIRCEIPDFLPPQPCRTHNPVCPAGQTPHAHRNTCSCSFPSSSGFLAPFFLPCFSTQPGPRGPICTSSSLVSLPPSSSLAFHHSHQSHPYLDRNPFSCHSQVPRTDGGSCEVLKDCR